MARKKRRAREGATTYASDKGLIANLEKNGREVLQSRVSEADFERSLDAILSQLPPDEIRYFYCRPCGEYHLRTHRHLAEMNKRKTLPAKSQKRNKHA